MGEGLFTSLPLFEEFGNVDKIRAKGRGRAKEGRLVEGGVTGEKAEKSQEDLLFCKQDCSHTLYNY